MNDSCVMGARTSTMPQSLQAVFLAAAVHTQMYTFELILDNSACMLKNRICHPIFQHCMKSVAIIWAQYVYL